MLWGRKTSASRWKPCLHPRSYRSLFIALACIAFVGAWYYNSNRHELAHDGTSPLATRSRRSTQEGIRQGLKLPSQARQPQQRFDLDTQKSVVQGHGINLTSAGDAKGRKELLHQPVSHQYTGRIQIQDHDLSGPEDLLNPGNLLYNIRTEQNNAKLPVEPFEPLIKGPVWVDPEWDPRPHKTAFVRPTDHPTKDGAIEAQPEEHLFLEQKPRRLPEVVHIPLEDAVKSHKLQGWEDGWVTYGTYDSEVWGKIDEPKIDFVYLC
jgi:hypothetical protein